MYFLWFFVVFKFQLDFRPHSIIKWSEDHCFFAFLEVAMLAIERLQIIKDRLANEGAVSVKQLSEELSVSLETIRRDLKELEKNNANIVRTHGGAYIIDAFEHEAPQYLRQTLSPGRKETIAHQAYNFVRPNDTIFLDHSTTALYFAKYIHKQNIGLTIITNSLPIAQEFSTSKSVNLILIGGEFRSKSQSFVGVRAINMLRSLKAKKCFISSTGIHLVTGITDDNEQEAYIRRMMQENSLEHFLLLDHYKFGKSFMNGICDPMDINTVITDMDPGTEWKDYFEAYNINVVFPHKD